MKPSFVDQFLKASFSRDGVKIEADEIDQTRADIEKLISTTLKDPCIVYLQNEEPLAFCLSFFTLLDKGHTPIPLSPDFNEFQKKHFLENKNRSWLENNKFVQVAQSGEGEILFKDSYACLTSGTTGTPKVCWLSVEGALFNAKGHAKSFGLNENHYLLQSLPLYHSFGISCYLWTTLVTKCHLDFNSVFLGMKGLSKRDLNNSVLYASPAQLKFMLKEKVADKIEGVDIISFGGGPAESSDIIKLLEKFESTKSFVTYGLTEAGPRVSTGLIDDVKSGHLLGTPFDGVEVKILDDSNKLLSEGVGKLCIKSPSLKQNLNNDEKLQDFLVTRDLVELKDNIIFFHSREQDLIKVGGISIYAKDIEDVIKEFDQVNDCLVISKNHKMYGEIPVAIIEGHECRSELLAFLKEKLSVLQLPKKFHFVEKFPRHSLDKINRKELKELVGESS